MTPRRVRSRWRISRFSRPLTAVQHPSAPHKARILHLITRLPVGGAEKVLVDVVRRLDPRRYESIVCCIQAKGELAAQIENMGVRLICLDRMQSRRFDWAGVRDLMRLMRRERISLSHSHL